MAYSKLVNIRGSNLIEVLETFILGTALGYALFLSLWCLYLAVTHLKRVGLENLRLCSKVNGFVLAVMAALLDIAFNVVLSIPFLDPPRELLATARLKRYKRSTSNSFLARYRRGVASQFCDCLLNPFDEEHC